MASYLELRNLFSDDNLKNRSDIAVVIAANNLLSGTPTTNEQKWAAHVASNPRAEASKALMFILAANSGADVSAIQNASDATLQTAVDNVVSSLVIAHTG